MFIPVTGFQCHSIPVNSGDCSGEITRISKFRGRSEILAGKFHWNGTGIRWNDWNLAEIFGASLRPHFRACPCSFQDTYPTRACQPTTCFLPPGALHTHHPCYPWLRTVHKVLLESLSGAITRVACCQAHELVGRRDLYICRWECMDVDMVRGKRGSQGGRKPGLSG